MKDFVQKAFSGLASKIGVMSFVLLLLTFAFATQASAALVINEIYGGGGNSGANLNQDFVELYNNGTTNVDISGLSLQYTSATSTSGTFNVCALPTTGDTIIEPGTYYLVGTSPAGANGTALSPQPNFTCTTALNIAATAGKVALVSGTTALSGATSTASGCSTALAGSLDFVGFGTTANCFEGTGPALNTSVTTSIQRNPIGTDTNNNAADFTASATNGQSPQAATTTVANPTVTLAITPATGTEAGQTLLTATVTASAAVTGDQTVNFALTSGTAGTADFVSIPATITILSGQTTGSATFNVSDDALVEGAESATFSISTPSSGITLGTTTTANVDVTDNDVAATAPTITSSNSTTFTVGQAGSFTVTTTGSPTPTLSFTGTLPSGVTFTNNGDGTATIAGTPAAGSNGSFPLTITASNGTAPDATQNFTLTVNAAPPTAAGVSLSGRVATDAGQGIGRAKIMLTGGALTEPVFAVTDFDGNYSFEDIPAGGTYFLSISVKGYKFDRAIVSVNLNEEVTDAHFTGTLLKQRIRTPIE